MDAAHKADAEVTIRSAEPEDAAQLAALMVRPGVYEGLLQVPNTSNATRIDYHQKMVPGECRLVAVSGGEIVGMVGLHLCGPSLRRQHARTLGIMIAPEWQGRGVGRQLIEAALHWADNWGHVLRIELHVHADNERAQSLYKSVGFVHEGTHRSYALRDGRYIDSLSMARIHPNPPRIAA